jgi:hypothetical protein
MSIKEACSLNDGVVSYSTARRRIHRGWDEMLAITTPVRPPVNVDYSDAEAVKTYNRERKAAWRAKVKNTVV